MVITKLQFLLPFNKEITNKFDENDPQLDLLIISSFSKQLINNW